MATTQSVVAVVVTHNRCVLLRGCLRALRAQTSTPETIVVVDNASTDDTAEVIRTEGQSPGVPVRACIVEATIGGAGGFALGMERALELGSDWIWLMDDDSKPEPEALAELLAAATRLRDSPGGPIGFLASRVLWTDGMPHAMNTPGRMSRGAAPTSPPGLEPVDYASFVSLLVNATAVRACGLPIAEFFIGSDDVEFSWRLTRGGFAGYHVERSRVWHLTKSNVGMDVWRLEGKPSDLERLALKIRNLVAVNRRRRLGWLRESVRVILLPVVWWWRGMAAPERRSLTQAARAGLFWRYESLIRFADSAPEARHAHSADPA